LRQARLDALHNLLVELRLSDAHAEASDHKTL